MRNIFYYIYFEMSKRNGIPNNETTLAKRPKKHWSLGLLESMEDPEYVYKESEKAVVIKDKYPKAKIHYLILPRDKINSIYHLNKTHISLLIEFGSLLDAIKKEYDSAEIVAGFHAVPSMQHLHMHVISKDMNSACLKTKAHWNSFTTKFFIPYEEILQSLKEDGLIRKISNDTHKELMATPLICNQCDFQPKNMPSLKLHLLTHNL